MANNGVINKRIAGVKVFSATMVQDRALLGEKVTEWLRANPDKPLVDMIVTQSSDDAFHCIAITVFYAQESAVPVKRAAGGSR